MNCMNVGWIAGSNTGNPDLAIPKFVALQKSKFVVLVNRRKFCEFSGLRIEPKLNHCELKLNIIVSLLI